ncbi:hypothetical protein C8R44DRAFT_747698 [Mycena epipterygia]|nr:hypothetical protein C8R44DRAFT_747698 [Mycena epipterygia]
MIILELDGVNGVALPPEGVADALVIRVGHGHGDEVEGAAHDVLVEEFMREVKVLQRGGARNEAAVVGVGGGREPVDVGSEDSLPFGHGEGGESRGEGRRHARRKLPLQTNMSQFWLYTTEMSIFDPPVWVARRFFTEQCLDDRVVLSRLQLRMQSLRVKYQCMQISHPLHIMSRQVLHYDGGSDRLH